MNDEEKLNPVLGEGMSLTEKRAANLKTQIENFRWWITRVEIEDDREMREAYLWQAVREGVLLATMIEEEFL